MTKSPHVLQFFTFAHLPEPLQEVSRRFATMAHHVVDNLPDNPQRELALQLLLQAKDAAVRAALAKDAG
jgi:hypothetical protein